MVLGFIAITLLLLLYRKFEEPLFVFTGAFLLFPQLTLTLWAVMVALGAYNNIELAFTWLQIDFAITSASIFLIPIWLYKILEKKLPLAWKIIWLVLALVNMADYWRKTTFFLHDLGDKDITMIITHIQLIWMIFIIMKNKNAIKINELRSFFNFFCLVSVIRVIYAMIDFVIYKFLPDFRFILEVFSFLTSFMFIVDIGIIIFIANYFFTPKQGSEPALSKEFIEMHGLTPREIEVVTLLLQGCTSKEMSEKMFISPQTAKNYASKVYQKINVTGKVDLIKKITTQM